MGPFIEKTDSECVLLYKQDTSTKPWRSLELIDTLLALAEAGHTHTVKEIFAFPQQHCPDVLTLGLMQINPPLTSFRTDLLVSNLQVFLANHPNSSVILTHAWQSSTFNLKVCYAKILQIFTSREAAGHRLA